MDVTEPTTTVESTGVAHAPTASDEADEVRGDDVLGDDLVEEISIDGMCGVY
jgi:mycofactocin precursor